jgi:membrane protein
MKNGWMKILWLLFKDSAVAWDKDNALRMGAAIANYTVLSLSPLLIIIIVLSSVGFGKEAASGHLVSQIRGVVGKEGAVFVQTMIKSAYSSGSSIPAAVFGIITLLFAASGAVVELRDSLNAIFRVKHRSEGTITSFVHGRLLSIATVIGIGFLVLLSLVFSAVVTMFSAHLKKTGPFAGELFFVMDHLVFFAGMMLLVALMFKFLPDAKVKWSDVWIGSAVTSLLFLIGKAVISMYLGSTFIGTTFGAASSLVIIMVWAFYSTQIILFGAEFTRLYADRFGTRIVSR